jgi:putative transport protein
MCKHAKNNGMDIVNLFTGSGTASTLVFLSIVGILGVLIGKIQVANVRLGIAGVLFSGLLIGHFGAQIDYNVLHFVKEFGLILFVFSIGLEVGPRFVSSLKSNGLTLNLLASGIVVLGFGMALLLKIVFAIPTPIISGIVCGAVTNTPALGAVQQVIGEQMAGTPGAADVTGMGYALAYPFGIIGIILVMILLRKIFKLSVTKAQDDYKRKVAGIEGELVAVHVILQNKNLFGKRVIFLKDLTDKEFALSRIHRNGQFIVATDETTLQENDVLYGVSSEEHFSALSLKVGEIELTKNLEITGKTGMRHVLITNKEVAGKTVKSLGISRRYPVNITRIYRTGSELMPTDYDTVEFGDTVRIVGERKALAEVAQYLGNSVKDLSAPNVLPILISILLGVIVGAVPLNFPGLPAPAKLGLAGGPLLIALLLGHKGRIGRIDFYMTPSATHFIRELGIILFLATVGLSSGQHFVETLLSGGYVWMGYGALITFVPLAIVAVIAYFLKINYLTISGMLAGSMTDPPALEFANSLAPIQAQSTAYATVYPLVMFLRVLLAQIFVLALL